MEAITLEGNRIRLRDWTLDDLDKYRAWLIPGHEWQRLDGPYYPDPTADEIPAIIDRVRQRITEGDFPTPRQNFVVADRATDRLIGRVSRYWISEETNWMAIGIAIYDPAHWNRGLGFEALGLWTQYLFDTLPVLARLDIQTWSGNHGMMRLALKLGYREEGRFRNARIVEGQYYDAMGYGVLREEWDALYPAGFAAYLKAAQTR